MKEIINKNINKQVKNISFLFKKKSVQEKNIKLS